MNSAVGPPRVSVTNLSKSFGQVQAVSSFNLRIESGELMALIGPDGAGKTTLLRLMAGLMRPDHGQIRTAGFSIEQQPQLVRQHIGYMPQQPGLLPTLTVAENIDYFSALYAQNHRSVPQWRTELLAVTGLAEFTGRLIRDLSGGMRQKASLVCALIHQPDVVLLDEPTRGLDPLSRRDLWLMIYRLAGQGVTVVVATPHAEEAQRCHRVGIMSKGELRAVGTPQSLAEQYVGRVAELQTTDLAAARAYLHQASGIGATVVQGRRLRIQVRDEGPSIEQLALELDRSGVGILSLQAVSPRLEDVLIALWSRGER